MIGCARAAALVATVVMLVSAPAAAQVSVEVSPLRVELQTRPGGSTTQAITLSNSGKDPIRVRARLSDWDLARDGAPQFEGVAAGSPFSATAWVRIAPPEQVIAPGAEATVRFSLTVPADVDAAGYRTGILFEFLPPTTDPIGRGREVQFRSRIATLIYVNIGQPPAVAELTDLRVRAGAVETHVIATLKNGGRRTVRTKGSLVLYDASNAAVRTIAVPDVPLLPESEREVAIPAFETAQPLPPGDYRIELKIDVGMPALIVGETTLTVAR